MLRVGLTGGIGSGKTTVANFFKELGAPIIDADVIAFEITTKDQPLLKDIAQHFGSTVVLPNGELDRKKLRQLIFNDPKEREWLEQTLHPVIRKEMKLKAAALNAPYCIFVIPLLAEAKSIDFIDRVLVVDVDPEIQIERAALRDNSNPDEIAAIMQSQAQREKRLAIADDVINNDGDIAQLRKEVERLDKSYKKIASQ